MELVELLVFLLLLLLLLLFFLGIPFILSLITNNKYVRCIPIYISIVAFLWSVIKYMNYKPPVREFESSPSLSGEGIGLFGLVFLCFIWVISSILGYLIFTGNKLDR